MNKIFLPGRKASAIPILPYDEAIKAVRVYLIVFDFQSGSL